LLPSKSIKNTNQFVIGLIQQAPSKHRKALSKVRAKNKVKVAFFLTHESVWKYDLLYNLLLVHPRFEPALLFVQL
jgi:hypothetical protein